MNIQKITRNDDLESIGNIYAQSWKVAYSGIIPQDYLDNLTGGQWVNVLADSKYDTYVILEDGKYVGAVSVCAARDEKMANYGEIVSLYLLPEYFGQGYAKPLFDCAVNALLEKGYRNIYLWVLNENIRAQRFYEKQGFHKNGNTFFSEIAGKELTDVRYVKSFPKSDK